GVARRWKVVSDPHRERSRSTGWSRRQPPAAAGPRPLQGPIRQPAADPRNRRAGAHVEAAAALRPLPDWELGPLDREAHPSLDTGCRVTKRIRVADLVGSPVEEPRGKRLGRVVDLELGPDYEVVAALIGPRSWLKRWNVAGLWG